MAKKVIWSLRALNDRKEILHYWKIRNGSNTYSKKLDELFKKAVSMIAEHPRIGRATDVEGVRVKLVRDYLIIYRETESELLILSIWDSRRNPEDMERNIIKA